MKKGVTCERRNHKVLENNSVYPERQSGHLDV